MLSLWLKDIRKLALQIALGLAVGLVVGIALSLTLGLYPWFENEQMPLGLIGLTFSLPLGAAVGFGTGARPPRHNLARGMFAGLGLAFWLAFMGGFLSAAISWFCAAALLGASLASLSRRAVAGVVFSGLWLLLCALPFFFERLAVTPFGDPARNWAIEGCPWLGFASNVYVLDPLRASIIYLGQWSALSDRVSSGYMTATSLWCIAALAMACALTSRTSK